MTTRIVIGVGGSESEKRAIAFAKRQAQLIGDCELIAVFVIEWSPYSFQTAEENAERHKRREEEIAMANERVLVPLIGSLKKDGFSARGIVRHGNVADLLESMAKQEGAEQIVVARASESSISQRIFGSSTANLVMHASVPVTVVS